MNKVDVSNPILDTPCPKKMALDDDDSMYDDDDWDMDEINAFFAPYENLAAKA